LRLFLNKYIKRDGDGIVGEEIVKNVAWSPLKITIKAHENSTWQGVVTQIDSNETRSFRSVLELMKLIDSALDEKNY
jgi:hypothetical protein